MAIAESSAVASIISKLLSMSTDLLERKESREVATEIRDIQKLTIQLQSLYVTIETKNSELQSKIIDLQTEKSKMEHAILNAEREKSEILKRLDEWDKYERKVSQSGFVYLAHKSELRVYACAVCKGKEPYPVILQKINPTNRYHRCHKCETVGEIE
jgi:septal ring factor EnvC (AmiA/AmiB activator)